MMMMMMMTHDDATNGVDDNDDVCYSDEHGDSVMALLRSNIIWYEIKSHVWIPRDDVMLDDQIRDVVISTIHHAQFLR